MGAPTLYAATLTLPRSCKNLRQAARQLHYCRSQLHGKGLLSFMGGVFEHLDERGNSIFHIHLLLLSTIRKEKMKKAWFDITEIPTGSDFRDIYDLQGWLSYLYDKNVNEAIRHKITRHQPNYITHHPIFKSKEN